MSEEIKEIIEIQQDSKIEEKEASKVDFKKYDKDKLVTKSKLLESGVQYGHQVQWWNPKMKPFISFQKNGIHIINLHKTMASLQNAYSAVQKLTEANKIILFVGTTKQSKNSIKENAERISAFYVDNRWLGGLLTNFKTIKNSINRLKTLERLEKTDFEGYTKKEGVLLKKELIKLQANLGGIKNMRRTPDAIYVSSTKAEKIAILEAKKLGIPVIGIVDTNEDPTSVEFPIFANDDAIKSTSLITTIIIDAIASKKGLPIKAAFKGDEAEIVGIDPNYIKPIRKPFNNGRYNNFSNNKFDNSNNKREETKTSNFSKPFVAKENFSPNGDSKN